MKALHVEGPGAVTVVTLKRPEVLNALDSSLLLEIKETFAMLASDASVHAIVLTGEGKAFAAGADIGEMKDFEPHEALNYALRGADVLSAIENAPQPVIAAVNGYALGGGCEMALACDIRLASDKARFGQPEVGLGVIPGFGGTQRLVRTVGTGMATQMILSGGTIDAQQALRIGLVNAVHAPDELLPAALMLAESIAVNAPLAVRAAKRAIRQGADVHLRRGIEAEANLFASCFATEDQKEGMTAFVEKRKPQGFKGK